MALAELTYRSHADGFRDVTRRSPGGVVHDEDGLLLYAGPHPLPAVINGAMCVERRLAPDEVVERTRPFFAPRNRGYSLQTLVGRDEDIAAAAAAAGLLSFGEPAPLMALTRRPDAASPPPGTT